MFVDVTWIFNKFISRMCCPSHLFVITTTLINRTRTVLVKLCTLNCSKIMRTVKCNFQTLCKWHTLTEIPTVTYPIGRVLLVASADRFCVLCCFNPVTSECWQVWMSEQVISISFKYKSLEYISYFGSYLYSDDGEASHQTWRWVSVSLWNIHWHINRHPS